jgi:translocation and assembly module TamA
MLRFAHCRRTVTILALIMGFAPLSGHAADPQPYEVTFAPTGDAGLDAAVRDSSSLQDLRDKVPVGGFALVQRARDDATRFEEAAHAFGYYDGHADITIAGRPLSDSALADAIDAVPAQPELPVTVTIDLGVRFHIGQIAIQGVVPPSVVQSVNLKPGQDAIAANVLAARDRLLAALRDTGYPLATVTLQPSILHPDRKTLDVAFLVETGPKAALGAIQFAGLRDVSQDYMRRRLTIRPGQPFSASKIEAARTDLMSVGVFSSVRIVPADHLDPQGDLPLTVDVEERKQHAVDVGAGWSTDLGANLTAAWHHRDLFGEAEQLNLTSSVSLGGDATTSPGAQIGVQFIKPDFLMRDLSLDVSVNWVDQNLIAYDQVGLIEKIGVTWKFAPHWSVLGGILAEQERVTQEGTGRPYDFIGLPVGIKYDSTKNLLDPTNGIRAAVTAMPVESLAGPGGFYTILQASGSVYLDLRPGEETAGRTVVAMRALVGQVSGAGPSGLPPDQRLYAGGSGTVRGYRYQSVGPLFADGKPSGGTAVSAASVEFRQRFLDHWGAAAFVDVGQANATGDPFTGDWHAGAGVGLRYYTSIGPIRLDVAVPLDREPGGDSFEFYIGIGQAF